MEISMPRKILVINGTGTPKTGTVHINSSNSILTPGAPGAAKASYSNDRYPVFLADDQRELEQMTSQGKIWPITTGTTPLEWQNKKDIELPDLGISPHDSEFEFSEFAEDLLKKRFKFGKHNDLLARGALGIRDATDPNGIRILEGEDLEKYLKGPVPKGHQPIFYCDKELGKVEPLCRGKVKPLVEETSFSEIYKGIGLIKEFQALGTSIIVATHNPDMTPAESVLVRTDKDPISLDKLFPLDMHRLEEHCQFVYKTYLQHAYTDEDVREDWDLTEPGYVIQRPNHGLAHTLRVANYAPMVLAAFQNSPIEVEGAKYVGLEKDLDKIQIALLFAVVARKNERGFGDGRDKYLEMRGNCAEAFKEHAKKLNPRVFTTEEIEQYATALINFGDPEATDPLSMIFKACHNLDLPRCYYEDQVKKSLKEIEGPMGEKNLQILKNYALQCIVGTGDRVMGAHGDVKARDYVMKDFSGVSSDVTTCLSKIDSVPTPQIAQVVKGVSKPEASPAMIVNIVHSHVVKKQEMPANAAKVNLNCPAHILEEFRRTIEGTKIIGASFYNPYTKKVETFPADVSGFTARHLQILARNESYNTNGAMKNYLYLGSLTDDQIARIRCLVTATTVSGVIESSAYGGYGGTKRIKHDQKPIIIDQAGLQWQGDFRNTGGMFFYPDNVNDDRLPAKYEAWQRDMYQVMYQHARPSSPSQKPENCMTVTWGGVKGQIALDQVANAIEVEFRRALDSAVYQGVEIGPQEKINFKYLKAGMGFFSSGLKDCDKNKLEMARLKGIEQALKEIEKLPKDEQTAVLGKIGRIELPWSPIPKPPPASEIENLVKKLNLKWGGTPQEDALTPCPSFVNATTNCADMHAMIGNEGGHQSVDASIWTNTNGAALNPAANANMQSHVLSAYKPTPIVETPSVKAPTAVTPAVPLKADKPAVQEQSASKSPVEDPSKPKSMVFTKQVLDKIVAMLNQKTNLTWTSDANGVSYSSIIDDVPIYDEEANNFGKKLQAMEIPLPDSVTVKRTPGSPKPIKPIIKASFTTHKALLELLNSSDPALATALTTQSKREHAQIAFMLSKKTGKEWTSDENGVYHSSKIELVEDHDAEKGKFEQSLVGMGINQGPNSVTVRSIPAKIHVSAAHTSIDARFTSVAALNGILKECPPVLVLPGVGGGKDNYVIGVEAKDGGYIIKGMDSEGSPLSIKIDSDKYVSLENGWLNIGDVGKQMVAQQKAIFKHFKVNMVPIAETPAVKAQASATVAQPLPSKSPVKDSSKPEAIVFTQQDFEKIVEKLKDKTPRYTWTCDDHGVYCTTQIPLDAVKSPEGIDKFRKALQENGIPPADSISPSKRKMQGTNVPVTAHFTSLSSVRKLLELTIPDVKAVSKPEPLPALAEIPTPKAEKASVAQIVAPPLVDLKPSEQIKSAPVASIDKMELYDDAGSNFVTSVVPLQDKSGKPTGGYIISGTNDVGQPRSINIDKDGNATGPKGKDLGDAGRQMYHSRVEIFKHFLGVDPFAKKEASVAIEPPKPSEPAIQASKPEALVETPTVKAPATVTPTVPLPAVVAPHALEPSAQELPKVSSEEGKLLERLKDECRVLVQDISKAGSLNADKATKANYAEWNSEHTKIINAATSSIDLEAIKIGLLRTQCKALLHDINEKEGRIQNDFINKHYSEKIKKAETSDELVGIKFSLLNNPLKPLKDQCHALFEELDTNPKAKFPGDFTKTITDATSIISLEKVKKYLLFKQCQVLLDNINESIPIGVEDEVIKNFIKTNSDKIARAATSQDLETIKQDLIDGPLKPLKDECHALVAEMTEIASNSDYGKEYTTRINSAESSIVLEDFKKILLLGQCTTLLNQIGRKMGTGINDQTMKDFQITHKNKIESAKTSQALEEIKQKLTPISQQSSSDVEIINKKIKEFREGWGLGKSQKANDIEKVLQKIPVDQRGEALSDIGVQVELAKHRSFWKRGKVTYKEDSKLVDRDNAAQSYKDLVTTQHEFKAQMKGLKEAGAKDLKEEEEAPVSKMKS